MVTGCSKTPSPLDGNGCKVLDEVIQMAELKVEHQPMVDRSRHYQTFVQK